MDKKDREKLSTMKTDVLNLVEKPLLCQEPDCYNRAYGKNHLTPLTYEWLCKKHYFLCVYGLDYPRETVHHPEGK